MRGRGKILAWAAGGIAALLALAMVGAQHWTPAQAPEMPPQRAPASSAEDRTTAATPQAALPDAERTAATAATPAVEVPVARPFTWSASREGNEVRLAGHVPSAEARRDLQNLVRRTIEGVSVVDQMREAGGLDASVSFGRATAAAAAALAELRSGRVDLSDRRLGIRGEARDKQGLAAVTAAFQDLPAGLEPSAVSVTATPVAPYAFSAKRSPGAIVLGGHVPDAGARAEIERQIRARFFHEEIVDQTRLGDGAPAGFVASAAFALDQLAQLGTGEASVTADGVRVAGDMLYAQAAEQIRDRVARGVPGGARGFAEIKVRGQATVRAEASP